MPRRHRLAGARLLCHPGDLLTPDRLFPPNPSHFHPNLLSPLLPWPACAFASSTQCFRNNNRVTAALSNKFFDIGLAGVEEKFGAFIIRESVRPDLTCRPHPNEPSCANPGPTVAREAHPEDHRRRLALPHLSSNAASNDALAVTLRTPVGGWWNASTSTWSANGSAVDGARRLQGGVAVANADATQGDYLITPPAALTFRLPSFTMARFQFDLLDAGVPPDMKYSDHYRIAIFVEGHKYNFPYTPSFWFDPPAGSPNEPNQYYADYYDHRWSKSSQFALHLHSMKELRFRVELQILHGLYSEDLVHFERTMTMEMLPGVDDTYWGPDRAHPGTLQDDGITVVRHAWGPFSVSLPSDSLLAPRDPLCFPIASPLRCAMCGWPSSTGSAHCPSPSTCRACCQTWNTIALRTMAGAASVGQTTTARPCSNTP